MPKKAIYPVQTEDGVQLIDFYREDGGDFTKADFNAWLDTPEGQGVIAKETERKRNQYRQKLNSIVQPVSGGYSTPPTDSFKNFNDWFKVDNQPDNLMDALKVSSMRLGGAAAGGLGGSRGGVPGALIGLGVGATTTKTPADIAALLSGSAVGGMASKVASKVPETARLLQSLLGAASGVGQMEATTGARNLVSGESPDRSMADHLTEILAGMGGFAGGGLIGGKKLYTEAQNKIADLVKKKGRLEFYEGLPAKLESAAAKEGATLNTQGVAPLKTELNKVEKEALDLKKRAVDIGKRKETVEDLKDLSVREGDSITKTVVAKEQQLKELQDSSRKLEAERLRLKSTEKGKYSPKEELYTNDQEKLKLNQQISDVQDEIRTLTSGTSGGAKIPKDIASDRLTRIREIVKKTRGLLQENQDKQLALDAKKLDIKQKLGELTGGSFAGATLPKERSTRYNALSKDITETAQGIKTEIEKLTPHMEERYKQIKDYFVVHLPSAASFYFAARGITGSTPTAITVAALSLIVTHPLNRQKLLDKIYRSKGPEVLNETLKFVPILNQLVSKIEEKKQVDDATKGLTPQPPRLHPPNL